LFCRAANDDPPPSVWAIQKAMITTVALRSCL
jgi:hypothetical protein